MHVGKFRDSDEKTEIRSGSPKNVRDGNLYAVASSSAHLPMWRFRRRRIPVISKRGRRLRSSQLRDLRNCVVGRPTWIQPPLTLTSRRNLEIPRIIGTQGRVRLYGTSRNLEYPQNLAIAGISGRGFPFWSTVRPVVVNVVAKVDGSGAVWRRCNLYGRPAK